MFLLELQFAFFFSTQNKWQYFKVGSALGLSSSVLSTDVSNSRHARVVQAHLEIFSSFHFAHFTNIHIQEEEDLGLA